MSASQTSALPSDGARQSPRGLSDPPCETLGPLGIADRLNWAKPKNRWTNTTSHRRIAGTSYARRRSGGKPGGQIPCSTSRQAWWARKAIFDGRKPKRSV